MTNEMKQRDQIPNNYKWDIESMYQTAEQWEADITKSIDLASQYSDLSGTLTDSGQIFLKSLKLRDQLWQTLEKAYVYSRMKRDEDNRVEQYQAMCDKAMATLAKVSDLTSFATPEILAAGEERILNLMDQEPALEVYRFEIINTLRAKDHVLTADEESLMAQMSQLNRSTNDIFTMLNNADIKFGQIKNQDGQMEEVTHGNYIKFMECHDRQVRKDAFTAMYTGYENLINTIATSYNYNTKTDVVTSKIRKYPSARAAALFGDNIPASVYDSLVEAVNQSLPSLHKYMEIRKELLAVDTLQMYDVYVPIFQLPKKDISYEEACQMVIDGLQPLGSDYIDNLTKGLESGWVDVYESQGKTSGAYSFGSYDSKPFVLLNYTNTLKDVFTLAHELGHSMHSFYTRKTQPFVYGSHSIFTAEVASTVNENLLLKHMIKEEKDPLTKKYLLNLHIEEFRTTLFRQTMFAEFEDMTHKAIESGDTLTAGWLNSKYQELNAKYFGPALGEDPFIKYEWSRIPHFYNAFYVYKYATGYSAAAAISDIILAKGSDDYIQFLKTGESDYPIELLKIAGVDMGTTGPVNEAMETFKGLVDELEDLL